MKYINNLIKRRGILFIIIVLVTVYFSFINLYGVEFWRLLGNNSVQVNLDEATLVGVEENEGVYLTTTGDAQIIFSLEEIGSKYIYVNMSNIDVSNSNVSDKNAVQLYYSQSGNFDEDYSIIKPMKEGNIVFQLPENNVGICRFDLGFKAGTSIRINSIQYSNSILIVPEFFYGTLMALLLLGTGYILYRKRKSLQSYVLKHKWEVAIVVTAFIVYGLWAILLPYNGGPDESMRYDIPKYIYKFGRLPRGDDPILCNNTWGTSYGFDPYLAYLFGAAFMKIANLFGVLESTLLYVARFVNVIVSTLTVIFSIKISHKIFDGPTAKLFVALVAFLPQFIFITAYINNDAMAILSTAIICYYWIEGTRESWSYKNCIGLAIGLAICLASYKNAYGYGLCSIIVFCVYYISKWYKDKTPKILVELTKKGFLIGTIVFVISGWWFVRNYIIYDGDFFGTETLLKTKLMNAADNFKPTNTSLKLAGVSLMEMLFDMEWLELSIKSFIAAFGAMNIFLRDHIYNIYYCIFGAGILGYLFNKKMVSNRLVRINFAIAIAIVCFLSVMYSYTLDYQPQGRYLMPMLIPLMIFVAGGLGAIQKTLVKRTGKNIPLVYGITILYIAYAILILPTLIIPYYHW